MVNLYIGKVIIPKVLKLSPIKSIIKNRLISPFKPIFFLIFLISISCHHYKKPNPKEIIEQFKETYKRDTCILLTWNSSLVSETDRYYLWKKYGILSGNLQRNNYYDSCRAEAMKQILTESKGVDTINLFINDLNNFWLVPALDKIMFYDSAYSHLIAAKSLKGVPAKINDESNYYEKYDSLTKKIKGKINNGEFKFWITVDTLGNLEKIEFVNEKCISEIKSEIENFYSKVKWIPAQYKNNFVRFRYLEFTLIK